MNKTQLHRKERKLARRRNRVKRNRRPRRRDMNADAAEGGYQFQTLLASVLEHSKPRQLALDKEAKIRHHRREDFRKDRRARVEAQYPKLLENQKKENAEVEAS